MLTLQIFSSKSSRVEKSGISSWHHDESISSLNFVTRAWPPPAPSVDEALLASLKWKGQLEQVDCLNIQYILHNIHDSVFCMHDFVYICFICIIMHARRIPLWYPFEQRTTICQIRMAQWHIHRWKKPILLCTGQDKACNISPIQTSWSSIVRITEKLIVGYSKIFSQCTHKTS